MTLTTVPARAAPADGQVLAPAIDRATGARPLAGNRLEHHPDSVRALDAMLELIARAERWVHFENYIIRDDRTGRRFAEALAERARAGVPVRVVYDALGSFGTARRYWRGLRAAGVEVRAFHPIWSAQVLDTVSRDHRKLLVTDGNRAMLGGLCIGDEWAGDPARQRRPWRDTMVLVTGPGAAVADRAFGRVWEHVGSPLPPEELESDPGEYGTSTVRIIAGAPGRARVYRAVELLAATARERLWITDAYLIAPRALYAALLDAARSGVDVRILVPGTSDLPLLREATRGGYRELLRAGARIYEWQGPMLHAKTLLADQRWGRVGSSNLNVSSLLGNYELDLLAECEDLTAALARQFLHDLAFSREIVVQPRRRFLPARLVGTTPSAAPGAPSGDAAHKRSGYELGAVTLVALRRVAGGLRRTLAATAAIGFLGLGGLLLAFPRAMSILLAGGAFLVALGLGGYAMERRRTQEADDGA